MEIKNCPFCKSKGEIKPGTEIPPTLDEAINQEPSAKCSNGQCGAHYILMGLKEWNTRAEIPLERIAEILCENEVENWEKCPSGIKELHMNHFKKSAQALKKSLNI